MAVTEPLASPLRSRRWLLGATGGALAGASALAVAGCGGPHRPHVKSSGPVPAQDIALIEELLALERRTIAAYEAGIPLLDSQTANDTQQFLRQELSHEGELIGLLRHAKVKPPPPTSGYDLGHPRTPEDVLRLLHDLEDAQLSAYLRAIPRLSNGQIRAAAAAIFANDAQHVAILRVHLHHSPAPLAFVTGRE